MFKKYMYNISIPNDRLNLLLSISAFNIEVCCLLIGAILIEALHPHCFKVFEKQESHKGGDKGNNHQYGFEEMKLKRSNRVDFAFTFK
jgi:hypothetical protein